MREPPPCDEHLHAPLSALKDGYSPRAQRLDPEHVKLLVNCGSELPPILVDRSTMQVLDGHHRIQAAKLRGEETIRVRFFEGEPGDGFLAAIRANVQHGKPLSLSERKKAATEVLRRRPELSDRVVSNCCGLSPGTIRNLRDRSVGMAESTVENEQLPRRVGRDGRFRPASRGDARSKATSFFRAHPTASVREATTALSIAPATARAARKEYLASENSTAVDERGLAAGSTISSAGWSDAREWFERTDVHEDETMKYGDVVPRDEASAMAREARRRSTLWEEFAEQLESKSHDSRR